MTRRRARRALLLVTVFAVVGISLLTSASPAAAHAVLLSTSPADRAELDTAPREVVLEFNERVSAGLGGVRAYDQEGRRVDAGSVESRDTTLRVALEDDLGDGAYVVTYRIVSADAHAIRGAFAFTVGDASAADDDTIAELLGEGDDRPWEVAGAVGRALAYGGALLSAGLALFLVVAHDGGLEAPRLRRWLRVGGVVGGVGVLAAIPIQAALATGLGIGAFTEDGVLSQVLGDSVGWSTVLVLAGLALLLVDGGRRALVTVPAALVATGGFTLAGHTATTDPRWLITSADALHLLAAAVWFGGLVGVFATLQARRGDEAGSAASVVARFSGIAALALLGVAIGGTWQGWYEVRARSALTSTTYGWVLVAKVAVVAAVAALGAWNRFRLVPAIARAPKRAGELLRRTVRLEGGLLVVAIALTAVLVTVTPARTAAGIGTIFSDTVALGDGSVNVVVDPNRRGFNEIHFYVFDDAGRVSDEFESLTLRLSPPDTDDTPLQREPFVAGPGHWQLDGNDLSISGEWTIEIVARIDRFDEETASVDVPVNP